MSLTVSEVSEYLEQWQGTSERGWALCCYHPDQKPSLSVWGTGFKCMSSNCGEHGSLEKLYKQVSGRTVIQTHVNNPAQWLWKNWGEKYGSIQTIAKLAHGNLVNFPDNGLYLKARKLDSQIKQGLFGYLDGYYILPIKDQYEQVVGLTARASPTIETKYNRYSVTHDCPVKMYVPNWRRVSKADAIYLCYGTLDVWTLEMAGLAGITGQAGQTFHPEYLDSFRTPIYIIPDKGEEVAATELQSHLGWRGMVLLLDFPDGCKDLQDIHIKYDLDTVSKLIEDSKEKYRYE